MEIEIYKGKSSVSALIDRFVVFVMPRDKDDVASVDTWLMVLCCTGMVALTTGALQMRATTLLLCNVFVRLWYPSAYYPASASLPGVLASPVTARCIAFVAEFALYEVWAVWAGVDFWGSTYLWLIVGFGEVISTTGLVLQSELLLNIEDSTWAAHACYMAYLSFPQPLPLAFFGGFGAHMVLFHLPARFRLMLAGSGSALKAGAAATRSARPSLFHIDPLFSSGSVALRPCEFEEKAWVVPMLLGQPLLTAVMYHEINSR